MNNDVTLNSKQEDKVVQIYETMMTRHCTMVVGPTGGGKTVVINTLIKAQCHLGVPTKCTTLNPKVGWLNLIDIYMCWLMHSDFIAAAFAHVPFHGVYACHIIFAMGQGFQAKIELTF